ncbi:uncharacterized protein OCT59_024437 [Rhizophagus irregularis]|uniref:uncharacterized protein n=1 Tax=Rhizophagus irregularis TaxID=588596 RepID=UPI003331F31A|nr:hypothetical protein OCT59_024437 [Rhizophagus irregularis]
MIFTDLRGTTKETNEKRGTTIIYPIKLLKDEKENYTFVHNPETSHYRTRGIGIGISEIHSLGSSEISENTFWLSNIKIMYNCLKFTV